MSDQPMSETALRLRTEAALRSALAGVNQELAQNLSVGPGGAAHMRQADKLRAQSAAILHLLKERAES